VSGECKDIATIDKQKGFNLYLGEQFIPEIWLQFRISKWGNLIILCKYPWKSFM